MKEENWKKRADERVDFYTKFLHQSTETPGEKPNVLKFLHEIKGKPASKIVPILQRNGLFEDFLRVMQRIARKIRGSFNDPMFDHEDMVQEALLRMTLSDTVITTTASGFVITTLRNLIYDTLRRKMNSVQHDDYFELEATSYGNFEAAMDRDLIETIHENVKGVFAGKKDKITYIHVLEMFIAYFGQEESVIEIGEANDEDRLCRFAQQYFADNYNLILTEGATKGRIYRFRQFMGERFPHFRIDKSEKNKKEGSDEKTSQAPLNEPSMVEQAAKESDSAIVKKFLGK